MKKIFTLFAAALLAVSANAQKEWNFSSWAAEAFSSTVEKDGLTIVATSEKNITIDGNKKTVDGVDYTQRIKLGGAGVVPTEESNTLERVLSFKVTGACSIYVVGMSSSKDATRTLKISTLDDNKVTEVGSVDFPGDAASSYTAQYTGTAPATILIYSTSGGINLYDIKWTPTAPSAIKDVTNEIDENAPRYNILGQRVTKAFKGVVIQNGKKFIQK